MADPTSAINYVPNLTFGQLLAAAINLATLIGVAAGWFVSLARQSARQMNQDRLLETQNKLLEEHGTMLDKFTITFHDLDKTMSALSIHVESQRSRLDRLERDRDDRDQTKLTRGPRG